jgi:Fe-S-cluster-containing dehydrogenase component
MTLEKHDTPAEKGLAAGTPSDASQADAAAGPTSQQVPAGCTLSRRRFLEGIGAVVGVVAAGTVPAVISATAQASAVTAAEGDPIEAIAGEDRAINYPGKPVFYAKPAGKQKWAMVIDVKACIGCRRCVYACVKENNIGRDAGFTYIQVLEMEPGRIDLEHSNAGYEEGGRPDKWYMPVQCMQCAEPPCVYGCPVKATWKEPDGIVVIDYDKCIACRNCIVTCPYGARHFNWKDPSVPPAEVNKKVPLEEKAGVVEKCTFCIQRTRAGETTACTAACPVGARKFGDLNDPDSEVSQILKTRRAWRLKEESGTEPMIWYVG